MQCDRQRSCAIQHNEVKSYSVTWSAGLTAWEWISGGFSVTQTVETGTGWQCDGNPGDYFAVWKKVGQTAYKVRNAYYNSCYGWSGEVGDAFTMRSPNANNKGSNFYCVYRKQYVRNIGDNWTDYNGRAGGP
jgi:hypothetical protein